MDSNSDLKNSDNKSFWQRWARFYASAMKSSGGVYREVCRGIEPYLNTGMNVLELACGSGQLSFPLSAGVLSWEAADFSQAMIEEAKKHEMPANLYFSVQDATKLSYPGEMFDAVVISNALHIMPHPEMALEEIRRVIKADGILFAPTFIHGEGKAFRLRVRLMELVGFKTYFQWDEAGFVKFLEDHGYTVTEHRIMGQSLAPLCFVTARVKKAPSLRDQQKIDPGADFTV